MWVCYHSPAIFAPYFSDVDETAPNGSVICQKLSDVPHTLRDAYAIVRAAGWLASHFPRVP